MSTRRKYFEIATLAWAIVLVILVTVHLTASPAFAADRKNGGRETDGWVDCGDSCAVYCSIFEEGCAKVWEWWGCGCTVWCSDGMSADVLCY